MSKRAPGTTCSSLLESVFCVERPENRLVTVEPTGLPSCSMDEDRNLTCNQF